MRQKLAGKGFTIPRMGRALQSLSRLGAILAFLVFFLFAPGSWAQDQSSVSSEVEPVPGESCVFVKQERRDTCKKSAETCTDVHRLDALNLIKNCAQLAQECDLLGLKEDVTCQPGGNGQVTLHH